MSTLLDLPNDIIKHILAWYVIRNMSNGNTLKKRVASCCDQVLTYFVVENRYGTRDMLNLSRVHPKFRKILKSACIYESYGWYFNHAFFNSILKI